MVMNISFYSNKTKSEYCLIPIRSNYTLIRKNTYSTHHIHPVYHIMFVTAGEGFLENDIAVFPLKEKDIIIINPNEKHIFTSNNSEGMTYITFNFYLFKTSKRYNINIYALLDNETNDDLMTGIAETIKLNELFDLNVTDIYFNYDKSQWNKIFTSFNSFLDDLEKIKIHAINSFRKDFENDRRYWFNLFSKQFWDFYLLLLPQSKNNTVNKSESDLMEQIISYLEDNIYEKFSLNNLATHLKYNPIYLCSYFKKNSGLTLNQYFNKLKILKSCEYLRSTNMSLTDIATLLNFSSSSHFSRNFKLEKNICPKDYRKHLEKY